MSSLVPPRTAVQAPPVELLHALQRLTTLTAVCVLSVALALVGGRLMRRHRLPAPLSTGERRERWSRGC
jgi:hypothetical protein